MGRKSRGIALSLDSIETIRDALSARRLTQEAWSYKAYVSVSTVKRLLNGERVDRTSLHAALEAIGLSINNIPTQADTLTPAPLRMNLDIGGPGIFMTATFVYTKRSQIERAIHHLQTLLINSEVMFTDSNDGVTVSGDFEEHNRTQIEMTIAQLERMFTSYTITW